MNLEQKLRVKHGKRVLLSRYRPDDTLGLGSKKAANDLIEKNKTRLAELQYLLYAENKRALLIVLQAVDAGGKDGTIRHVMSGLNPQGCAVTSFKVPSAEEADHDYLWRVHHKVPPRGEIGIFNRSHYEDVLVVRVRKLAPAAVWSARYDQINAFEKILVENGVSILKFYLHISKQEQKRRIQQRIEDPTRNWKLSEADFRERKYWDNYVEAFEDMLGRCSTPWAPWYVIPADRKWVRNLAVSRIIVETLEALRMKFPPPSIDLAKLRLD